MLGRQDLFVYRQICAKSWILASEAEYFNILECPERRGGKFWDVRYREHKGDIAGMSSRLLGIATQIMVMTIVISVVLLFVGIAVLVMIHVCVVGRAFRRGFDTAVRGERCRSTSKGLSPDDLEKIPCYDYKVGEKGRSPVDCVVCLESFQIGDRCRLLPLCKHSFHAQCVDSWLLKTPICPICRTSADRRKALEGQQSHPGIRDGFELIESQPVAVEISASVDQSLVHAPTSE